MKKDDSKTRICIFLIVPGKNTGILSVEVANVF